MDSPASEINARLEKLERENSRMKKIGIAAIVFVSVLFISGQAKTNQSCRGERIPRYGCFWKNTCKALLY
jgi:hypothetical protein